MKKNLGLLITGSLLFGGGLILSVLAYKETGRRLNQVGEVIKANKKELEKYSVNFE